METRRLCIAALLRAASAGCSGVVLGLHLAAGGFAESSIGFVVSAGIAGGGFAALAVTGASGRLPPKRTLILLSVLSALGAAVVMLPLVPWLAAAVAFLGMLNGVGRDRGAAMVIEHAILPSFTDARGRTRVFAFYNFSQDIGHAIGGLLATIPEILRRTTDLSGPASLRCALGLAAALSLGSTACYLRLRLRSTASDASLLRDVSRETKRRLGRISALFGIDSLAGGFLTSSLISLWFHQRFGAGEGAVGLLFFASRAANAGSHLLAARLAARFGLLKTMVFTHAPSSLLLVTVAFAPSFPVAAILFLLREGLVEMDVPTRQSYVMTVVRPEERTFASGVTNLVRTASWAVMPSLAGVFMQSVALATPLFLGAGMKIVYDVLLWLSFRRLRPPEERGGA
jgi:MFS family permease